VPLDATLAQAITEARDLLANEDAGDKRQLALVVTKLEEAALWLCEWKAREHLGDQALLDWLNGV
jgi:hypothetical protein